MGTLGILILWAGYTTGIFGLAKIKGAYGVSPSLSISDLALPSHRETYIAAVSAWASGSSSNGGTATGTGSSGGGSGASAPVPGSTLGPPTPGSLPANPLDPFGPSRVPSPLPVPSGPFTPANPTTVTWPLP